MALLASGYFFDLQTMVNEFERLSARESVIKKQIQQMKSSSLPVKISSNHSKIIREFVKIVNAESIAILSLAAESPEMNPDFSESYQVLLSGSYLALRNFFIRLADEGRYEIGNLQIEVDKLRSINLSFVLHVTNSGMPVHVTLSDKFDPFCNDNENIFTRIPDNDAIKYSIEKIRLLGVVMRANVNEAVIEFPSGVIQAVVVNSLLGSEGGRIAEININHMVVLMPDHTRHIIQKFY